MNRKVLFGFGCLGLIIIGVIAAVVVFAVPRFFEKGKGWFNTQLEESARRSAMESAWKEPSARPDASWFPAAVDAWTLRTSEDFATLQEMQLDRPGRRGTYRGENQDIEVTVVPVSDLELSEVFARAKSNLESRGGNRMTTQTPGRLYMKLNGNEHTRMWWIKDWLFIFRTTGPEDPDAFAGKYLNAMTPGELEKR